jgi:hypothetical protein
VALISARFILQTSRNRKTTQNATVSFYSTEQGLRSTKKSKMHLPTPSTFISKTLLDQSRKRRQEFLFVKFSFAFRLRDLHAEALMTTDAPITISGRFCTQKNYFPPNEPDLKKNFNNLFINHLTRFYENINPKNEPDFCLYKLSIANSCPNIANCHVVPLANLDCGGRAQRRHRFFGRAYTNPFVTICENKTREAAPPKKRRDLRTRPFVGNMVGK